MICCINENCKKKINQGIIANADGDMACNEHCRQKYIEQQNHFLDHIISSDHAFATWIGISVEQVKT
jgi:hypothetical protein